MDICEYYSDIMTAIATKEAPQSTATKQGFKQVTGESGNSLFVLNKGANYSNSMTTLEAASLRPMKHQEALLLLTNDATLKESLKGKWFYLEGKGLNKELELYTIDAKGELVERKGEVSVENTVRVWNGPHPLSLGVASDSDAAACGRRIALGADDGPSSVAPVVVGIAKDWKLELKPSAPANGREAAAPKIADMLRVEKENTAVVLTFPHGDTKKIEVPEGTTVSVE
jgi:hypothetical protein